MADTALTRPASPAADTKDAASTPAIGAIRVRDASGPARRQLVRFALYRVDLGWRRLDPDIRAAHREEALAVLHRHAERLLLRTYSLVGTRGDADCMLWVASEEVDRLHQLFRDLNRTAIGGYLEPAASYTSMTKRSLYFDKARPGNRGGSERLVLAPGGKPFLFVYPFVKTRAWWALPPAERERMMDEHIRVGRDFTGVKINTTYSFGLDDQEFVVAFEADSAAEFLDCVQALRDTEASAYTLRDVPSFTCMAVSPEAMLDALG